MQSEVEIQAPVEACFDAARDMRLHPSSMGGTDEKVVGFSNGPELEAGDTVVFSARHFGVRWKLEATIPSMDRPREFVDASTSWPFRSLRHIHSFRSAQNGTTMTDEITFDMAAPFNLIPIGRWFVAPHLRRLLIQRGRWLKDHLESKT